MSGEISLDCSGHLGEADAKARDAATLEEGDAIGRVVDVITHNPEQYQAEGLFASTWKYAAKGSSSKQLSHWRGCEQNCIPQVVPDTPAVRQFNSETGPSAIGSSLLRQARKPVASMQSAPEIVILTTSMSGRPSMRTSCRCWRSIRTEWALVLELMAGCYSINSRAKDISEEPNVAKRLIQEWVRSRRRF